MVQGHGGGPTLPHPFPPDAHMGVPPDCPHFSASKAQAPALGRQLRLCVWGWSQVGGLFGVR